MANPSLYNPFQIFSRNFPGIFQEFPGMGRGKFNFPRLFYREPFQNFPGIFQEFSELFYYYNIQKKNKLY